MLSMTKKTGYGLIALTHLARLGEGELASAREIAEEYGVPQALLMNVLKDLSSAGLVRSVRGAHGGYRMDREPDDVNLVELMETLEGPVKFAACITGKSTRQNQSPCKLMARCPISDPVHRVHRKIHDFLCQMTLADVISEEPTAIENASV